jgi:heme/copper-type cytochrome/quinol oxidase subunit 2
MSGVTVRTLILVLILLLALVGLFLLLRPNSPSSDSSTSAGEPQEQTFDLEISEGTMTPNEISVDEGKEVVFRITSDAPIEFHVHGYDLETEVEPDEPAELAFDATNTGRFEIEDHDTETELGTLLVQPG